MSLHVELSPEAQEKLKKQAQKSTIVSLLIAFVVISLMGVVLGLLTILIPAKEVETIISYQAPVVEEETNDEPKVRVQQRQVPTPPSAASAVANVITTTAPTSVSIPDTNSMTNVESPDFGSMDDFGMGFGFEETMSAGTTAFGKMNSSGLQGFLVDIKQDPKGELNDLGEFYQQGASLGQNTARFKEEISSIMRKRYSQDSFGKYFKASNTLGYSTLVLDKGSADIGPKCFGAENEIQPSGWIAVYEGVLAANHSKKVRFLGRFDDILLVYVNEKLVLDGSWQAGYTQDYSDFNVKHEKAPKLGGRDAAMGPYISLRAGDEIRVVVGEVPGGSIVGGLFIEEEGVENPGYKKDGQYRYIPFCTQELNEEDRGNLRSKKLTVEADEIPVFTIKR